MRLYSLFGYSETAPIAKCETKMLANRFEIDSMESLYCLFAYKTFTLHSNRIRGYHHPSAERCWELNLHYFVIVCPLSLPIKLSSVPI